MSQRLPTDTNNNDPKKDDSLTADCKAPPGSEFSPVPLISPIYLKLEGGADELPGHIQPGFRLGGGVASSNLMSDMSQEELSLMADMVAPFGTSHDSFPPIYSTFEGGADVLPRNTQPGSAVGGIAAPTNLMSDMSQEEPLLARRLVISDDLSR